MARDLDIPLIHISTDYVFSGQADKPWKVSDETRPLSAYGKSKLLGENVIKEVWPDKSIVLRTAWLYGPHGKNFAKTIIKKAASHEGTIKVVSDQRGQPTTTTDLAIKIIEVANSKIISGVFHATNSGEASWWDFARELYSLMGKSEDLVLPIPAQDYPTQVIRPSYTVLDHAEWEKVGLSPMRNWNNALSESFPSILAEVERELSDG
jgi:dTDP-4-dehydrorhamnose reductase